MKPFIPHESLSALIGPNGSGKTNILSAIRLLPALCHSRGGRHFDGEEPISTVCEIKTWYEIDELSIIHTAKLNLVTNEKNQDEIISSYESWSIPVGGRHRKKFDVPSWILLEGIQDRSESPRVLWRVKFTREWSPYEQDKQIFPRSQRTRSPSGARASQ